MYIPLFIGYVFLDIEIINGMNKICLLTATICIVLMACKSKKEPLKPNRPSPVTVDVMIAQKQNIINNIEVNGSVIPFESVEIKPEVSGRITFLNIAEGSSVNQGTILAKINDADLQAQLAKIKVQLSLATATEARLKKLLAVNGINQSDYDVAVNTVNNLKADLNITQAQIDKTIIKAPFSGSLGLRQVSMGAYVTPANTLVALQQTDKAKIDFTVPELYTSLVKKGSTVKVQSNNGQQFTATIIATESQINANTRNLIARAVVNKYAAKAGSFVKVFLGSNQSNSSILVPTNCIIPDAKAQKVIIVKDGKGKFVEIVGGLRSAGNVAINKGVNEGDSIVVTGVLFFSPNSELKIRSIKKPEEVF